MAIISFIIWFIIGIMQWLTYLIQKPDEREMGGCSWSSYWICWFCLMLRVVSEVISG